MNDSTVVTLIVSGILFGTPLALVVRNRDHKNWTWGMSPWQPEGEPSGKGTKPVTLPRWRSSTRWLLPPPPCCPGWRVNG